LSFPRKACPELAEGQESGSWVDHRLGGAEAIRLLANLQHLNFTIGWNLNLDSLPYLLARKRAK